jgi:hypothetical protein
MENIVEVSSYDSEDETPIIQLVRKKEIEDKINKKLKASVIAKLKYLTSGTINILTNIFIKLTIVFTANKKAVAPEIPKIDTSSHDKVEFG